MPLSAFTRRQAIAALVTGGAAATAIALNQTAGNTGRDEQEVPIMDPSSPHPIIAHTSLPAVGPWPTRDPFLFCVHHNDLYPKANTQLGPNASLAGRRIGSDFDGIDGWNMYHGETVPGFPRHPHRGFETVTLVRRGLIDHADSLGASARYGDGDVQWLTAGDGINHAEMFPLLDRQQQNPIDFFQIWLNLPAANKRVPPHFSMFWAHDVPRFETDDGAQKGATVRVVSGDLGTRKAPRPPPNSWASQDDSHVAIWTIELDAERGWTLPAAHPDAQRSLYVVNDETVVVAGQTIAGRSLITLRPDQAVTLKASQAKVDLLLLQGAAINEPVARHGPFVMNTREEIQEAFRDYRRTGFGGWPWSRHDPVHGETRQRFALHADGRRETPG